MEKRMKHAEHQSRNTDQTKQSRTRLLSCGYVVLSRFALRTATATGVSAPTLLRHGLEFVFLFPSIGADR